jgi:hypothetical protein
MPDKRVVEKAMEDRREGKSPSTQAGEFVRDEMRKIRSGEHGAESAEQAVAIGLSEARRAGVDLPPPKKGRAKPATRRSARYAYEVGQGERKPRRRPKVSRAVKRVRFAPRSRLAFGRGAQGFAHEGTGEALRRRAKGGEDPRPEIKDKALVE